MSDTPQTVKEYIESLRDKKVNVTSEAEEALSWMDLPNLSQMVANSTRNASEIFKDPNATRTASTFTIKMFSVKFAFERDLGLVRISTH